MTALNTAVLVLAGLIAWGMATVFYAVFGGPVIERAFWFYVVCAFAAALPAAAGFRLATKLMGVRREKLPLAACAFVLPALVGQLALTPGAEDLFRLAGPETVSRYVAYVLFAQALVFVAALRAPSGQKVRSGS